MNKHNVTILYVENEKTTREELSKFLLHFCSKLYTASNGENALEIYKLHKPTIVISDICMPLKNGIDLAKEIKQIYPEQLLIFISAHSQSKYLLDAIEMQADGYILKPIDFSILEKKLLKLITFYHNTQATQTLKESEEKFRKISENTQVGIFIYKHTFIYVNEAFCHLTGYTEEELLKMQPWVLLHKEMQEKFQKIAQRRLQGEEFHKEYSDIKIHTKKNQEKILRVSASTIKIANEYAGMAMVIDVSDFIYTQERLSLLAQAVEQMDEMVRITSVDGIIIYVNNAILRHTGYTKEELIGQTNRIFKSEKNNQQSYKILWETILNKQTYHNIFINKKKNGDLYYEDQTITPIIDEKTKAIKYFVSTSQDITQTIKMTQKLKNLATRDTLTQVYNRYKINEYIEEEFHRAQRYHTSFALLMFDIDHFKIVNDTYGHDIGDYVLQEFAKIIQKSIRQNDKFGRWGGEEFMLLSPETPQEKAYEFAEKLRKIIEMHPFEKIKQITVSVGVIHCHGKRSLKELFKDLDDALYEAKKNGRNRVIMR